MDGRDQAALLFLMERGRVNWTGVGRMADERLDLRVVAAANDRRHLSREEFLGVVRVVLVRREKVAPEAAEGIARLTPQLGVQRAVALLLGSGV